MVLLVRPRGPMDKASDYESGDSRFESEFTEVEVNIHQFH